VEQRFNRTASNSFQNPKSGRLLWKSTIFICKNCIKDAVVDSNNIPMEPTMLKSCDFALGKSSSIDSTHEHVRMSVGSYIDTSIMGRK